MKNEIENWLIQWFQNRNPTVSIDINEDYYRGCLIDSFGIIELIGYLEREFNVFFDDCEFQLPEFRTISGLVGIIEEKDKQQKGSLLG